MLSKWQRTYDCRVKEKRPINNSNIELHTINENEMIHLEDEFKDYKDLYPSNQYIATI